VGADGCNRLGKVSNRRWEKTEEWEQWQDKLLGIKVKLGRGGRRKQIKRRRSRRRRR
jgi:hypothetical protein